MTAMKIQTKDFGVMEIDQKDVICFPGGIFAFEDATEFALIKNEGPSMVLQCVKREDPRFVVFEPSDLVEGYSPELPGEVLKTLQAGSAKELGLLVIAVVPENIRDMTVNLKSPIVWNREKRIAAQVILDSSVYPVRYRVFD
jgi:flagellar assembly factor FliW